MPALAERVDRWMRSWRDIGDAFLADDALLCDEASCDCDVSHAVTAALH